MWAYSNAKMPMQDFQLNVMDDPYLILEFASDCKCPNKKFFLESIYVWVGDKVRHSLEDDKNLEAFLEIAKSSLDPDIIRLVQDVKVLLADPDSYSYENWGLGTKLIS